MGGQKPQRQDSAGGGDVALTRVLKVECDVQLFGGEHTTSVAGQLRRPRHPKVDRRRLIRRPLEATVTRVLAVDRVGDIVVQTIEDTPHGFGGPALPLELVGHFRELRVHIQNILASHSPHVDRLGDSLPENVSKMTITERIIEKHLGPILSIRDQLGILCETGDRPGRFVVGDRRLSAEVRRRLVARADAVRKRLAERRETVIGDGSVERVDQGGSVHGRSRRERPPAGHEPPRDSDGAGNHDPREGAGNDSAPGVRRALGECARLSKSIGSADRASGEGVASRAGRDPARQCAQSLARRWSGQPGRGGRRAEGERGCPRRHGSQRRRVVGGDGMIGAKLVDHALLLRARLRPTGPEIGGATVREIIRRP